ncbi:MAG: DMT family transporter [SAR202 cluster bacterium]|jgi:drug/metabolite transporter (DMT)-like permease|nr:DMT family transporter [SAR202 cluster bacterium]
MHVGLLPSGFALFLSLLWGGTNVSIKASLKYGTPLQVGWIRFVLGGVVIAGYMVFKGDPLKIARHEVRPLAIIGLLFSIQMVFMNVGQDLTTAGHALAVNTTYPIWAAIIAHLLIPSDRLTRWKLLAIVFSYGGILVVVFGDTALVTEGASIRGDLLSLAAAILLGLRMVLTSNFSQTISESKLIYGQALVAIPLFFVGSYILEEPAYSTEPEFLLALAYQGFVIAGFGYLGNAWLIRKYLPSTIGFFFFIQPVAGLVLAWLILGEDPGRGLIAGLILVSAGALIFSSESIIKARRQVAQVSNAD